MGSSTQQEVKQYHHGNLREALIFGSIQLIEQNQNIDFSVRELSRKIGVSANAAYKHFNHKDDLLTAIAAEGFKKLLIAQEKAFSELVNVSDKRAFVAGGRAYIIFAIENPTLFKLMFSRFAVSQSDPYLKKVSELTYLAMQCGTELLLKEINTSDLLLATTKVWSVVHGLSYLVIDGHVDLSNQDIDQLLLSFFKEFKY